jgi:hypothetical protein
MMADIACRYQDFGGNCSLLSTICPAAISDHVLGEFSQALLSCYEPRGVTASDILACALCGLMIVAGSAIMLLFAASRVAWL